jgi:DNA-binding PadR family transcriptional regulator
MPKAEFTYLKEQTGASSGNISVSINVLKKAGYIDTEKVFQGNTPKTFCRITYEGLWAFKEYVKNLQKYFN